MNLFKRVLSVLSAKKYLRDKIKNETTIVITQKQMAVINSLAAKTKIEPTYIAIIRDKRYEDIRRVSFVKIEGNNMYQTGQISIWSDGSCPILDKEEQTEENETFD